MAVRTFVVMSVKEAVDNICVDIAGVLDIITTICGKVDIFAPIWGEVDIEDSVT